ncbi:MAG: hypothetical protein Ct9H300mP1_14920 [Planctomycetaceae bacterium]|nr:MAG: hypothetical protein Ct9H300mP1_14920 [Planctomycetaceae bacterium]
MRLRGQPGRWPSRPRKVSKVSCTPGMLPRLLDGQFEESGLTLSDLHVIEESLTKSMIGIFHGPVTYPEQRTAPA